MTVPVLCIIGASGSGKTTLLEKLIPELKSKGYRIATVKHHSHVGFDIDVPGKDSWRHAKAGSDHVVIAAPDKIASYRLVEKELLLDEIINDIKGVDLILVEGYRRAGKPSIEIVRGDLGIPPSLESGRLIAIASDVSFRAVVPVFDLNDAKGMANLVVSHFLTTYD
jgi:molybdopterin-guanine dinucleotide biosynthesis protein MobB